MVALSPVDKSPSHAAPAVRTIALSDLRWALAQGWRDFLQMRGEIVVLALVYPAVGLLAAAFAVQGHLTPLLFPLVAGLSILGPAAATGFFELARRRDEGQDAGWEHFLDPFRRRASRRAIAALSLGLALLFALWVGVALSIHALTVGALGPLSNADFVRETLTTPLGWTMIVTGNLAGLAFAAVVLVTSLTAFPMVVDGRAGAFDAVETSIAACARNPGPVAAWGALVAVLLALACLPLFLGLPVVLPVLGYASWRLYTRLIDRGG